MSTGNSKEPMKITAEDLAKVAVPEALASPVGSAATASSGAKSYGTISEAAEMAPAVPSSAAASCFRVGFISVLPDFLVPSWGGDCASGVLWTRQPNGIGAISG